MVAAPAGLKAAAHVATMDRVRPPAEASLPTTRRELDAKHFEYLLRLLADLGLRELG